MTGESRNNARKGPGKATIVASIAIVVVIACSFAVANWMSAGSAGSAGSGGSAGSVEPEGTQLVAIVHDGEGVQVELPLDEGATYVVETSLGTNTVVVQDGSVHVSQADCSNHDCIRQGAISQPGQQIICLPHKLWIEIVPQGGASGQMDVNAVPGGAQADDGSAGIDSIAR